MLDEKVPEDTYLDYKGKDALNNTPTNKKELIKDVSSFANAGGGKIIYGINEKDKIPYFYEEIEDIQIKKEWIYQILNNIRPKIDDIEVIPVKIGENPNRGLIMVVIPKSYTVHQAQDNIYHKRSGDQSLPMEDYEIREGMFRGNAPLLKLRTYYVNEFHSQGDALYLKVVNEGRFTAKKWAVSIIIDKKLKPKSKGWSLENYANWPIITFFLADSGIDIHPGLYATISGYGYEKYISLSPKIHVNPEIYSCKYKIYAEDMIPQSGKINIRAFEDRWQVTY